MTMLKAALRAQALGFHIFPVAAGAKVPHSAAGSWGQTATNDFNAILHFWTKVDPNANIGVACKPSQLLVVDLDVAKAPHGLAGTEWAYLHDAYGETVDGEALIDEMDYKLGTADGIEYRDTMTVSTGSGGVHLYYRWPSHWPAISQASPVKGLIDVRGNGGQWGGYVLGEGSENESGSYVRTNSQPPVLPPTWIRQIVAEKPQQPKIQRPQGLRQPGALSWSGLVASVVNAGEGNRNNALLWAARSMYSDNAPESEALEVLGAAARQAGLGDFEIERTIQSAYRIQQHKEG